MVKALCRLVYDSSTIDHYYLEITGSLLSLSSAGGMVSIAVRIKRALVIFNQPRMFHEMIEQIDRNEFEK